MVRRALNSRLWGLVRRELAGGEETLRDLVALLRQEDKSGRELAGTERYTSIRLLTDEQLKRLVEMVEERCGKKRRRSPDGTQVTFLTSPGELRYVSYLAGELGWSKEALDAFTARQTEGKGLRTHALVSAVVEPMERMLRERGYTCEESCRRKWWTQPSGGEA